MKKVFTTQLDVNDFKQMEKLRKAMGMKRSEFIRFLLRMFCMAYPETNKDAS